MKLFFLVLYSSFLALSGVFAQSDTYVPKPPLSHDEVLSLFKERTTPDELARFQELSVAKDQKRKTQALQMVLFKLTDDEMFRIGVTAVAKNQWAVAWSRDSKADMAAVGDALAPLHIQFGGAFGVGSGGWYVPRESFFAAQRALRRSKAVRRLGITVVDPQFHITDGGD